MATEPLGDVIRRMGRLTGLQGALSLTDDQLLEQFVARRDEPAFAALMVRHGPMVLCLCRQMLRDTQEAEDAFQAAFLVLVRNAGSIRKRLSLSSWLYGVAYRVAARLRGRAVRRRTHERPDVDLSVLPSSAESANPDLRRVLHDEVRRLPEKYRTPVVLCYLESKTNEEAAQQLRWPVGTVKARLSRAREMLRLRLARRGMGAAAALLAEQAHSPARSTASVLPLLLLDSTIRAAMRLAAGAGPGGLATARAAGLAKAVAAAMQLAKLKMTTMTILAALVLGAGTSWFTMLSPVRDRGAVNPRQAAAPAMEQPAQTAAAAPPMKDVAEGTTKPNAANVKGVAPCPNDVCKLDAVQRLRELVEQLLSGTWKEKAPEPRTEQRRPEEWQAHPYPQMPAEKDGPDCTES